MEQDLNMPGVSKQLSCEDVTLHYVDYGGTGSTGLLMLHGGGANTHWFDFIGPSLARHCRALALDLRGHGDSSHMEPPGYTSEAYMRDIRALIEAEQLRFPILMGHSMGGMLLVKYTGTWPREVAALIVCDARPVYGVADRERLQSTGRSPGREYVSQADYVAHFRIRPDGLRASPEVHRYIAAHTGRRLPHGTWTHKIDRRVYAQRETIDTLPLYQQITCPVLFLRAESSRLTDEMAQHIKDACPQVEMTLVEASGHHLTLDQPEQTIARVEDFLRRHHLIS
jgi:pimeloyl-ACP methyl ester carboxylesterase